MILGFSLNLYDFKEKYVKKNSPKNARMRKYFLLSYVGFETVSQTPPGHL